MYVCTTSPQLILHIYLVLKVLKLFKNLNFWQILGLITWKSTNRKTIQEKPPGNEVDQFLGNDKKSFWKKSILLFLLKFLHISALFLNFLDSYSV